MSMKEKKGGPRTLFHSTVSHNLYCVHYPQITMKQRILGLSVLTPPGSLSDCAIMISKVILTPSSRPSSERNMAIIGVHAFTSAHTVLV